MSRSLAEFIPNRMIRLLGRARAASHARSASKRLLPLYGRLADGGESARVSVITGAADRAVLRVMADVGCETPDTIVKVAWSDRAAVSLILEAEKLSAIHADRSLGGWSSLVPRYVGTGESESVHWMSQTALDGEACLVTPEAALDVIGAACASLAPLHARTAKITQDPRALQLLIDEPLRVIADVRPRWSGVLEQLSVELLQQLSGPLLTVADSHGDFAPSNVLFHQGRTEVAAIVDWELAQLDTPPEIDMCHFLVAYLAQAHRVEHGDLFAQLLRGGDSVLVDLYPVIEPYCPNGLDSRSALMLAWVHHIASNLTKTDEFRTKPIWLAANIDRVLDAYWAPSRMRAQIG